MKKFLLSIFAVMLAVFSVQAEEVVYTLTPAAGSNSSYTGNCDIAIDGITWNLEGNSQMQPWRIGGKQIENMDRALYSKTSMDAAVDKVVVTSGANTITVNSAKLLVADNGDFTNAVEYSFNLVASGSVEIPVTAKAGSYYKFVFNVTNTTKSNKYILFSEAKFYGTAGGGETPEPEPEDPETPVTPPAEGEVVDVLDYILTGATSTTYIDWSGKKSISSAVYAGNSSKSTGGGIQLRSDKSNSGIVTTKSGGKAKKIVVEWQGNTTNGRTLEVYGKNSAYTNATDLYSITNRGTLLGSIVKGTSTELVIEGDYEYIGMRSASGAMYLTSISITWDASAGVTPVAPNAPVLTKSQSFSGSMTVTITSDATVYYTTDGTTPSKTNGTVYTAPFEITATTTVKAVAVNEVGESDVAEATYTYLEPIDLSNCTVAEAIEAYKNGQTGTATITAYIVGAANGGLSKAEFTSETGVLTNILIADNADETNVDNCMPIKMASGTAVRNALNLGENKYVYKKKVVIVGELEAYFSVAGIQNVEKAGLYWTVSNAGYATLYLGYKAEIPSTVNAYIVESTNSTHAIMTKVEGVVAANTGLILEGEGEHLFNITSAAATADVKGNLLKGTVVDENITEDAYVLSDGANGIGLYGAIMNQVDGTAWLNNANKAYLPMSAVANKSAEFFGFDWDGTTAIENVDVENEVKAIYDLTGRRVEEVTAPGIYIVNGKKVLVK